MLATVTAKGQITVPKPVRDRLKLRPGDRVEFFLRDDGTVEFAPVTNPVKSLKGILPRPARSVSLEDMDRAIRQRKRGR